MTWRRTIVFGLVGSALLASVSACVEPSEQQQEGVSGGASSGGRVGGTGAGGTGGAVNGSDGGAAPGSDGGASDGGVATVGGAGGSSGTGGRAQEGAGGDQAAGGGGSSEKDDGIVLKGVRWVGRVEEQDPNRPRFSWSGTGFLARFRGTGFRITMANEDPYRFRVVVDDGAPITLTASEGEAALTLAANLPSGEHSVSFSRETEGQYGVSELVSVEVDGGELLEPPPLPDRLIEIVGDSISCGYGNLGPDQSCPFSYETESHFDSYGAVTARTLNAELSTIAISGHGVIRNYDGGTSDLMPISYERTITMAPDRSWNFEREPDVIVVNLGTNDFAKGDPGLAFEDEYFSFLADLRDEHPDAFLLATLGPMLQGDSLSQARVYIQSALASMTDLGDERVGFLEYSTQGSGELGCDWHPNTKKHAAMAGDLSAALKQHLGW